MRILNLYAGLGGNRRSWTQNHEVTAVEMEPDIAAVYSKLHPNDKVIISDAHQYLLKHADEFDFIWSSPPCQSHSRMMKATRHNVKKYPDLSLYQEIIYLQNFYRGQWVVENVNPYYTPLITPSCKIGRHIFWSNFLITKIEVKNYPGFICNDTKAHAQALKNWLGIQYEGEIYYKDNHSPGQVLRNCVPPEIGAHILNCAAGKYEYLKNTKQLSII